MAATALLHDAVEHCAGNDCMCLREGQEQHRKDGERLLQHVSNGDSAGNDSAYTATTKPGFAFNAAKRCKAHTANMFDSTATRASNHVWATRHDWTTRVMRSSCHT